MNLTSYKTYLINKKRGNAIQRGIVLQLGTYHPPNIHLDEDALKMSFVFVFKKGLQDVLIKTNIFILVIRLYKSLQDVLVKTNIFVLAIDIFQIYSRRLVQNVFPRHLQNVFKSYSKNVFKTSSRGLQDVLERYLQDVSDKTYHQVKLFLLTSLRDVFDTFLRRTARKFIYRRICLGHSSEKIMVSVQNLQES